MEISLYIATCLKYLSESLLYEFLNEIFPLVAKGPISVSLPLQHDHIEQTEEWKLHFARKRPARK